MKSTSVNKHRCGFSTPFSTNVRFTVKRIRATRCLSYIISWDAHLRIVYRIRSFYKNVVGKKKNEKILRKFSFFFLCFSIGPLFECKRLGAKGKRSDWKISKHTLSNARYVFTSVCVRALCFAQLHARKELTYSTADVGAT